MRTQARRDIPGTQPPDGRHPASAAGISCTCQPRRSPSPPRSPQAYSAPPDEPQAATKQTSRAPRGQGAPQRTTDPSVPPCYPFHLNDQPGAQGPTHCAPARAPTTRPTACGPRHVPPGPPASSSGAIRTRCGPGTVPGRSARSPWTTPPRCPACSRQPPGGDYQPPKRGTAHTTVDTATATAVTIGWLSCQQHSAPKDIILYRLGLIRACLALLRRVALLAASVSAACAAGPPAHMA
jgi:hypothetical protein